MCGVDCTFCWCYTCFVSGIDCFVGVMSVCGIDCMFYVTHIFHVMLAVHVLLVLYTFCV